MTDADLQRIDLTNKQQLLAWSQKFGVEPAAIQYAVEKVGADAEHVRRYVNMLAASKHRE